MWVKKWLCKNAVYYSDKPYRFILDSQQQFNLQPAANNNKAKVPLIQIVGRKHYSEQSENYPISNRKELANLVKINNQNANNEPNTHSAYSINALEQEQSKVTYWQFNVIPTAWLNLPETLLISNTLAPAQVASSNVFAGVFITQHQQSVFSALASPLINNPERFAAMFGIPCKQVITISEPAHYAQTLIKGLKAQSLKGLASFFSLPVGLVSQKQLKKMAAIIASIFVAYGTLTSGYLVYKVHALNTELEQNKASVDKALTTLEYFQLSNDELTSLQAFTSNQQVTSSLFFVMQQLYNIAEISNIRFEDNRYVIRGNADKATDALQVIISNPRVNDAKFDYPSRKERRGESFVISFTLNTQQDQATPTENNPTLEAG